MLCKALHEVLCLSERHSLSAVSAMKDARYGSSPCKGNGLLEMREAFGHHQRRTFVSPSANIGKPSHYALCSTWQFVFLCAAQIVCHQSELYSCSAHNKSRLCVCVRVRIVKGSQFIPCTRGAPVKREHEEFPTTKKKNDELNTQRCVRCDRKE